VQRQFTAGDVVQLVLPMGSRWVRPHPRIDAIRGTVAVERGPVVMCMESVDLGESVTDVRVDTSTQPRDADGVTRVRATTVDVPDASWPYREDLTETVHADAREVALIPYHQWANRGPSTMRVWLPEALRS
jgi:DUF1680 family protein